MHSDNQHILIVGFVWPEPESSAAGHRMMQLISLFHAEGWKITFACAAAETEYMADLASMDIDTVRIEINSSAFDTFLRELQPTVVMFDRFVIEEQFGWRVAENCPGALRVLDTEDLHCLRRARQKAVREGRPFSASDLLSDDVAKREVASILRSDLSMIISEAEQEFLTELFGVDDSLLIYIPYLLDFIGEEIKGHWPAFEERNHFITIGNFRHDPNLDAVKFLRDDIWPLIREELAYAELHVYGAYPSRQVEAMHQPGAGFHIRGRAEDAKAVVQKARVCLAPLRFGAGLKGKLVEAMQCGTPSVTTAVGAEGIAGELEWNGSIADEPRDIAAAAVELFTNRSAWQQAQERGIRIINQRFSKERFGKRLIGRIGDLQQRIEEHRLEHFTGEMLMYHTMASTKYMSRWIEEKNNS